MNTDLFSIVFVYDTNFKSSLGNDEPFIGNSSYGKHIFMKVHAYYREFLGLEIL